MQCLVIKSVQRTCPFNEWVCEVISINTGLLGTLSYSDVNVLHDFLESGLQLDIKCAIQNTSIPCADSFKVWCDKVQALDDNCLTTERSILQQVTLALNHMYLNTNAHPMFSMQPSQSCPATPCSGSSMALPQLSDTE